MTTNTHDPAPVPTDRRGGHTDARARERTDTADRYRGTPAELYERHFVPQIGQPCAEELLQAARLTAGARVVDIACGTGIVARCAAAAVGPSGVVSGVDANPGMLAVARGSTSTPIDWYEASAQGLPFGDGTFDVALCSLGLQFFPDARGALAEMRRVVTDRGRIAVAVPGPTPPVMGDLHDALASHLGHDAAAFVRAVFAIDDPDRLAALCTAAGSSDVRVTTRTLVLHLDPPAEFLWQYLLGTPLAGAVAHLDSSGRQALERDVVERWSRYETSDGTEMSVDLHIAVA